MRALLLVLCVGLSACGMRGFYKPGADYRAFYNDLQSCDAETSPQWSFCTGQMCGNMAAAQTNRRNMCMKALGWEITRKDPKFVP